jgi:dolichyl-phosphate-mannose--protein O-mannosyl transferase
LALGTPLLWWLATIALAVVIGFWLRSIALRKRDPAALIIVAGMAAGYLPWFFMQHRTVFSFYSIVFEPFLILALVYCAQQFLRTQANKSERAYLYAQMTIGTVVILIAINFIYFLPLYLGLTIPYSDWIALMWMKSWI